ncbi:hypothetical protein [Antarcticirhabdus aurantiaca]|uniref:Uncharacterized protein n=1 Tax=Antarcticirhabdus aurantiaca TaxID=2606717 RepID=A0ACD4NQX3_9HYPH|nr:hypothetical protein OXU80_03520 [Jeongeuplla avenae]
MDITMIDGCTRIIGASQGYLGLPLRDEVLTCAVNGPGTPAMVSAWRPTPEELALLNAGEPVLLRVLGVGHPPVMLWVEGASVEAEEAGGSKVGGGLGA